MEFTKKTLVINPGSWSWKTKTYLLELLRETYSKSSKMHSRTTTPWEPTGGHRLSTNPRHHFALDGPPVGHQWKLTSQKRMLLKNPCTSEYVRPWTTGVTFFKFSSQFVSWEIQKRYFRKNLFNLVILDKIIIAAPWIDAKRLARKRLLEFYYISVVEKTNFNKEKIWS